MSTIDLLSKEIASFYPELQMLKKIDLIYKEDLKKRLLDSGKNSLIKEGLILHFKTRKSSEWDPEAYKYLENEGLLHLGVTLKGDELNRYELGDYILPADKSLKMTTKRLSDSEKVVYFNDHILKITGNTSGLKGSDDYETIFKNLLSEKTFEEVINFFKINKISIKSLEQKLEKRRASVFKYLVDNKLSSYRSVSGVNFKLNDTKPEYDLDKICDDQILKLYNFKYKILSRDGDVRVIDKFRNNEETIFKGETLYYGQRLSIYKGKLHVNGQKLNTDVKQIFENPNGDFSAVGHVFVDSSDLFYSMPISSTKVDVLLDNGIIENEYDILKYKKYDEENKTTFFEVISEESDEARKNMFKEKLEKRRKFKKEPVVYKESDFETEEDDLFNIDSIF